MVSLYLADWILNNQIWHYNGLLYWSRLIVELETFRVDSCQIILEGGKKYNKVFCLFYLIGRFMNRPIVFQILHFFNKIFFLYFIVKKKTSTVESSVVKAYLNCDHWVCLYICYCYSTKISKRHYLYSLSSGAACCFVDASGFTTQIVLNIRASDIWA